MTDTVGHTALSDAMHWCQKVNATVRFYDTDDGPRVRVAVRDPRDRDEFKFALVPIADSSPESLAVALSEAREEIEPSLRRGLFRAV